MNETCHPQFCSITGADLILRSIDDVCYRLPAFVLRNSTAMFRQANTGTVVAVPTHSRVLTPILTMISGIGTSSTTPLHFPTVEDFGEAISVLVTWDAPGPLAVLRGSITSYLTLYETIAKYNVVGEAVGGAPQTLMDKDSIALRLYGLASRMDWEAEAKILSRYTLGVDIWQEQYREDMHCVDSRAIMRLVRLRRRRREEFRRIISKTRGPQSRLADESHATCTGSLKAGGAVCQTPLTAEHGHALAELQQRMFWELDRLPLGDTLLGALETDAGEWPESRELWNLKCAKCDKSVIDRFELMRDVKSALETLASCV